MAEVGGRTRKWVGAGASARGSELGGPEPAREPGLPDHETVGHAPSEAVVQDNLVLFHQSPKSRMKFLVQKLPHCNEEKEKGYFKS